MNLDHLANVANQAVDVGAEILRTHSPGELTAKGDRDYASEVDFLIEHKLKEFLADQTPSIECIGEETGADVGTSDYWWALDPIDGTINFAHGLPLCGISLGLIRAGQPVLGVIDLPFLQTRYTGGEGQPARCSGTPIKVSSTARLHDAIVSLGDYAVGNGAEERNELRLQVTRELAGSVMRIRMLGSAALDLAWLAQGRLDASITLSNRPWDVTAGVAIARAAGATVIDRYGADYSAKATATIGVSPLLAQELVGLLAGASKVRRQ